MYVFNSFDLCHCQSDEFIACMLSSWYVSYRKQNGYDLCNHLQWLTGKPWAPHLRQQSDWHFHNQNLQKSTANYQSHKHLHQPPMPNRDGIIFINSINLSSIETSNNSILATATLPSLTTLTQQCFQSYMLMFKLSYRNRHPFYRTLALFYLMKLEMSVTFVSDCSEIDLTTSQRVFAH